MCKSSAHFLVDLEDNSTSEQNSRARPDGSQEVGQQCHGPDEKSSKIGSDVNISVEFFLQESSGSSVGSDVLLSEILGYFFSAAAGVVNIQSGDQSAGYQSEQNVDDSVDWILDHALDASWSCNIVNETSDRVTISSL